MLLCHQCGCKSFDDIRTVSNILHNTYRSACDSLGLLGEDREWLTAFEELSSWATSSELRILFVHMLLFCEVSQPLYFWETQWKRMADDIRLRLASEISSPEFFLNDADLQESILLNLEKLLNTATPSKSLADFGLPMLSASALASVGNRLLLEETCYDRPSLAYEHCRSLSMLNSDQRQVYDRILSSYHTNSQVLLFVYGHGGTGKMFLWRTIISFFRSIGKVVLAVAASGIASLLLPSGRTDHSRFKISLDLTEQSTCHIKKGTHLADLLKETLLVIWDEAPMSDRRCFECLDKTFRDITDNVEHPFGGKSILLGGDFRQTLPVKVKCTRSEIIDATLPRSYLLRHFKIFELHENMRLKAHTDDTELSGDASEFASWLLQIGDDLEPLYPQEYLNQLTFPGIPPHELPSKNNTPVILIRNINQTMGLCNGTRLIVTRLLPRIIEAQVITGTSIGQSLKKIGVYLLKAVFTHGQLYVSLSRATSPSSLKILIEPTNDTGTDITRNVVFSDFIDEVNNKKTRA
ncbi:hypothetical protein CASFOL_028230 [Castilleja foliolosa]|uniref:ATP-dependent DNA helicase n=1 Tax=Castilleja foliolosa TaxID=1961234 RepID=A0ABD3CD51_9LAMI